MSAEALTSIVITDYSNGDDQLAGTYVLSQAEKMNDRVVFVAGFGNRSTAVSFENLQVDITRAVDHLPAMFHNPTIVYGEDTSESTRGRYVTLKGDVVYFIHGNMGHDGSDAPPTSDSKFAVSVYEKLARENEAKIAVLSLAATTELPIIIDKLHKQISELVIMGGVLSIQGNTGPHREANFTHDPIATEKTLQLATEYNIPLTLVPLDATEQEMVLFDSDRIKYLASRLGNNYGMHVVNSVVGPESVYGEFYRARTYQSIFAPYNSIPYNGVPVHDLTAAIVQTDVRFRLGIFSYTTVSLQPNILGEIGLARGYMQPNYPVSVATELLDYDEFWRQTADRLASYRYIA